MTFDAGYIYLCFAALLPVLASVLVFYVDRALPDKVSYWPRQIAIGILFGCLAIIGTEWGVRIDGAILNCRDAAPLCAGLLFGGPAGVIAGLIGGIERFCAASWGAGTYTQIACSVSTALAGFYAAAIRRFILDYERPSGSFAFVAALVMESFHMAMVFITHVDAVTGAFNIVLICAPPMLLYNSFSVMLATVAVTYASRGTLRRPPACEKSILQALQSRLLAAIVIAFLLLFPFEYAIESVVVHTAKESYLYQNLILAQQIEFSGSAENALERLDSNNLYYHVGDTGYLLLIDMKSDVVLSGPEELRGRKAADIGLSEEAHASNDAEAQSSTGMPAMYAARVEGVDCLCMDAFNNGYRYTAVYPVDEAYLDRDRAVTLSLLIQIILFAVSFMLAFFFVRRRVVDPVHRVNRALEEITNGNLDTEVEERCALEFSELSDGINTTVDALQRYTRESKEYMARELELAKAIQYSSLPNHFPPYPDRTEFDIFARMDTAKEVGGDFYDFFMTYYDTLNFLVADVSGKGIPAALFMMRAKAQIKSLVESGISLDDAFTQVNNILNADNDSKMFITAWQGSINFLDGVVSFVNAGHNPPVVRHGDGRFEFLDCKRNFVLAVRKGIKYTYQELQFESGDIIFLYTDGVTEAANADYELYGNDRLLECLNNARFDNMEELCAAVKVDIDCFVQGAPQSDDITMLAVRYLSTGSSSYGGSRDIFAQYVL